MILAYITKIYIITHQKELPYRNLTDSYGYIYVDVESNNKRFTTIQEGPILTSAIAYKDSADFYGRSRISQIIKLTNAYIKIYNAIRYNKSLVLSDSLFNMYNYPRVNLEKAKSFAGVDLLSKGYIKKSTDDPGVLVFNDSISNEDYAAIVYVLLKNKIMDCRRYCESGGTYLVPENKR